MQFVVEQERLEADRKRIAAQGVRDAQALVAETLDDEMLHYTSIQAFEKLAASPNAKVIVTDGSGPLLVDGD